MGLLDNKHFIYTLTEAVDAVIALLREDANLPMGKLSSFKNDDLYRKINTLSHDQVNQPIYTGSLDRWKNYEKHISALSKRLKTVIANY